MDELEQLQKQIAKLEATVETMDKGAQMLVRRDLELNQANDKLQLLDRSKSEFVSIAAHQMRTPLSAIKWSQQMLFDQELGPLNKDQKKVVRQTQHSVTRLVRLINNLLDADHLELGKHSFDFKEVNLLVILKDVVNDLRPNAEEKKVKLEFHYDDGIPKIRASAERLQDIFFNLIDNAIKYTKAEGSVVVRLSDDIEHIRVSVKDTGMGIPTEHIPKLFTRFSRADNARRVDPDGSGLGLYIVKRIIEVLGGTIEVHSAEGEGTEFLVSFPLTTNV